MRMVNLVKSNGETIFIAKIRFAAKMKRYTKRKYNKYLF